LKLSLKSIFFHNNRPGPESGGVLIKKLI